MAATRPSTSVRPAGPEAFRRLQQTRVINLSEPSTKHELSIAHELERAQKCDHHQRRVGRDLVVARGRRASVGRVPANMSAI
ncbi:hypothetical protein AAVH_34967, partial [Aphelenchoides avenae]